MVIQTSKTPEQVAKEFPQATDADKKQIENAAKGRIIDLVSKKDVLPEAAERGFKLIQQAVKEGANWTREMFLVFRMCEDVGQALGSLGAAERRAIEWFRATIKENDPTYTKAIKGLNDIAKYNGQPQLTYSVTKSRLVGIIDNSETLCDGLQSWWNYQAKHDGEPQKALPAGYLELYHSRYGDEKKGAALFMKDAREAQAGIDIHAARLEKDNADAKRKAASQTGQNGEQDGSRTTQGMESGTRQRANKPDSVQQCLNAVVRAVDDNWELIGIEATNGILSTCVESLQKLVQEKREEIARAVREGSSTPSQAIANAEALQSP